MKIDRIELRDFRCYEHAEVNFSPLTIIRGANHKGKSTIQMAAQLALTGIAKGTDGQGRFANRKIRKGAKKAFIDTTLSNGNGSSQTLKVTYGPNKTGRQVASEHSEGFKRWLETRREALCCALNSGYFIGLTPERQQAILASLVLPTEYDFPEETIALAARCGFASADSDFWSGPPVAVITAAYDWAFDERRKAKAALEAIRLPAVPEKPERTSQEVNEALAAARKKVAKLSKATKGNQRDVDIARLEAEEKAAQQRIETIHAEMNAFDVTINVARDSLLPDEKLKELKAIAANRSLYDSYGEQMTVIEEKIEEQQQIIVLYENLKAKPLCPTCLQMVSPEFLAKQIDNARQQISQMRTKLNHVDGDRKAFGDVPAAEQSLAADAELQTRIASLRTQYGEKGGPLARAKASLGEVQAQLKTLRETAEPPVDTTELDAATREVSTLEAQLTPAIAYEAGEAQLKAAQERQQKQTTIVNDLEAMCSEFGKDGIQAKLISANIQSFEAAINSVLSYWGYAAVLSIEPYVFEVNGLPLTELSESEEMMFGVALQTAISAKAGIGTVIVDRGDVFVGAERTRLFSLLARMLKENTLQQAIVMVSDENREYTPREGVSYYAAADGKVAQL